MNYLLALLLLILIQNTSIDFQLYRKPSHFNCSFELVSNNSKGIHITRNCTVKDKLELEHPAPEARPLFTQTPIKDYSHLLRHT